MECMNTLILGFEALFYTPFLTFRLVVVVKFLPR